MNIGNDSSLPDFFQDSEFGETNLDDIFNILEALEGVPELTQRSTCSSSVQESETELEASPKTRKRLKLNATTSSEEEANPQDGQQKMSHITVERNRRKQMNEHLLALRSLMPSFYVKRGDQASVIGGVVDYINELQQVLQSLEAKKQRKVYSEVLSPRLVSSPRPPSLLSPRKPPPSPRLTLPISPLASPRTPQPTSPYKPRLHQGYLSPNTMAAANSLELSPSTSSSVFFLGLVGSSDRTLMVDQNKNIDGVYNELVANSKSAMAEVEVKFCGANVLLKTKSPRVPGQVLKIISALEGLSLEILNANINTIDETMLVNSFTIKVGIECQLSAEELAHQIQQTFC